MSTRVRSVGGSKKENVGRRAAKVLRKASDQTSDKQRKSLAASVLAQTHGSTNARFAPWSYSEIRSGIASSKVRDLERDKIISRDDVRMIIPDRTLERRIHAKETLKTEEADGIARLMRVVSHARAVFDDDTTADRWLRLPNPALGGEIPIHMAATDLGAREVEAVLTRLEHGVFS